MTRVLVPRGASLGDRLSQLLEEEGLEAVSLPLIEIAPADDEARLDDALTQLGEGRFDWLVVTSQSTVRYLPHVPVTTHVAAVGNVTAAALRQHGAAVSFVPSTESAAGLVDEWPIAKARVLWPRSAGAKPTIKRGLEERGMQVVDVVAYQSVPIYESTDELRAAVAEAGELDAVLITSGSVAKQVARLELPPSTLIIAIGEQTAEDCERAGLAVSEVASSPTPAAMVAAVQRAVAERV